MSNVTNLMIYFSIFEDEISKEIEINSFFNNGRQFKIISANFEEENDLENGDKQRWYGGSKCLETPLFIGAFNHLDLDGLVTYLKQMEWEEPQDVQIILKGEEDSKFRILSL